jgi:hydroxymethylpyrimidine/phosphomethylpyrimidine kinase
MSQMQGAELLERNKNVALTRRLLPAAESVTLRLNEWSQKLMDRPSDRPNNKQTLH